MAPLYGKRDSQWERIVRYPRHPAHRLKEVTFPTAPIWIGSYNEGMSVLRPIVSGGNFSERHTFNSGLPIKEHVGVARWRLSANTNAFDDKIIYAADLVRAAFSARVADVRRKLA
jgi:hypothetical protein